MQLINMLLIILCIWIGVSALARVITLAGLLLEWISDLAWDIRLKRRLKKEK